MSDLNKKFLESKKVHLDAYVINGNDQFWNKQPDQAMRKHKAMTYISSLIGTLAVKVPCDKLIDACRNFHLVTPIDTIPI